MTDASSIRQDMTVLDIVYQYKSTQEVFKKWDDKAGECICCNALFETLEAAALKYGLDLAALMDDLRANVASNPQTP